MNFKNYIVFFASLFLIIVILPFLNSGTCSCYPACSPEGVQINNCDSQCETPSGLPGFGLTACVAVWNGGGYVCSGCDCRDLSGSCSITCTDQCPSPINRDYFIDYVNPSSGTCIAGSCSGSCQIVDQGTCNNATQCVLDACGGTSLRCVFYHPPSTLPYWRWYADASVDDTFEDGIYECADGQDNDCDGNIDCGGNFDPNGDGGFQFYNADLGCACEGPSSPAFGIRGGTGGDIIAAIGSNGIMAISGLKAENAGTISNEAGNDFMLRNSAGTILFKIKRGNGEMKLLGTVHENEPQGNLNAVLTANSQKEFIIKDSSGNVAAYISQTGHLYLRGNLLQGQSGMNNLFT